MTRQSDASKGVKYTEIVFTNQALLLTEGRRYCAEIHMAGGVLYSYSRRERKHIHIRAPWSRIHCHHVPTKIVMFSCYFLDKRKTLRLF